MTCKVLSSLSCFKAGSGGRYRRREGKACGRKREEVYHGVLIIADVEVFTALCASYTCVGKETVFQTGVIGWIERRYIASERTNQMWGETRGCIARHGLSGRRGATRTSEAFCNAENGMNTSKERDTMRIGELRRIDTR